MPSRRLEHLVHTAVELPPITLLSVSMELQELRDTTEIPRQRNELNILLGRLGYEASARELEASHGEENE